MISQCRRVLVLFVVCALTFIGCLTTSPAEGSWSIRYTQTDMNPGEALLIGAVAAAFNLETDVVIQYQSKTGTIEGAVSVAYTSEHGNLAADVILRERERGTPWERITGEHKLPPGLRGKSDSHPGRANHLAKAKERAADPYEISLTIRFLANYYGTEEDRLVQWVESGLTVEDVALILNMAKRKQVVSTTVAKLRLEGESWERLAIRFGISLTELKAPVAPVR